MEVAEVGAPGGKKVSRLLLCHKSLLLFFFVVCLPCVCVMKTQSFEMACFKHAVGMCDG